MKKISVLFLSLCALGVFFTSCTGEFEDGRNYTGNNTGNSGNYNVENAGVFKATIAGEAFVANTTNAVVTDNYVAITGFRSSKGDLIQIILPSNKVGTYTWENSEEDGEKFVLSYSPKMDENAFVSASNEVADFFNLKNYTDTAIIKIAAVDKTKKTISGTFQFTGFREIDDDNTETKVITNGSFSNIPYTENLPAQESDHLFTAKIDGVEFIKDDIEVASISSTGSYPYYSIVGTKNGENSDRVGLSINKSYAVGTYQASSVLSHEGDGIVKIVSAYCRIDGILYNSESGSITITSKTATHLEGTYNFVVSNFSGRYQKTITGTFNINTEDID